MRKKKDKKKKGLLVAIFCVAIFMAIGYAALQAELTINAVGKIYSDWDVEFTESECELTSAYNDALDDDGDTTTAQMKCLALAEEYDTVKDHLGLYTGGIKDDGDNNKGTVSEVGGIELSLYTEFATPGDVTEFTIEITNFSSMWDAVLKSIIQTAVSNDPGNSSTTPAVTPRKDWILYEFSDLVAYEGISDVTTTYVNYWDDLGLDDDDTTVLAADTSITFTITAKWNTLYENEVPTNSIKKDNEQAAYTADGTETYKQVDKFVLLWEAYAPGTNPWTP